MTPILIIAIVCTALASVNGAVAIYLAMTDRLMLSWLTGMNLVAFGIVVLIGLPG